MSDRYGPPWRALAVAATLLLPGAQATAEVQFERAVIYLEHNAADGDIEARMVATADDGGFAMLRVIAPDGRTVFDFRSPASKLGIRQVDLESPEPRDMNQIKADFPEGTYRFEATLVDGATLRAEVMLQHALPSAPTLSVPREGQTELPAKGAKVRWEPPADAAAVQVVLKERKGQRELRVTLPGNSTVFAIPDGFLVPGSKYEIAVGSIHQSGNRSYQEIEFTAQKR